jgi:hypothetical protein
MSHLNFARAAILLAVLVPIVLGTITLPQSAHAAGLVQRQFTQTEINQYLSNNIAYFWPVESIAVRLLPGEIQADVRAYGMSGTFRSGITTSNGRIVTINPQISGMLGWFVSGPQAAPFIEQQVNSFANPYNYYVTAAQVQDQAVTVTLYQP